MIYIHICVTLITLSIALYLFGKSYSNPSWLKWIWYMVIAGAMVVLAGQVLRGFGRVFSERSAQKDHNSYHHNKSNSDEAFCSREACRHMNGKKKNKCKSYHKGHKGFCKRMSCSDEESNLQWEEKIESDTTDDGKVIRKKIIIKRSGTDEDVRELEYSEQE